VSCIPKTERPVRTASATQVPEPIHQRSIGRWHAHEAFLGPLLAELGIAKKPLHLALPNAPIIHVVRGLVDACVSCFSTLVAAKKNPTFCPS
jgi:hypothetical protein